MHSVTTILASSIFTKALETAKSQQVDVAQLCAAILTDYFLADHRVLPTQVSPTPPKFEPNNQTHPPTTLTEIGRFDVSKAFPYFPSGSIEYAQAIVDEVLKIQHPHPIGCARSGYGIKFHPNFVWIERIHQQGGRCAITLSLYGEPTDFKSPPPFLKHQRNSYSRALIESSGDLAAALPLIREAYELRYKRYRN